MIVVKLCSVKRYKKEWQIMCEENKVSVASWKPSEKMNYRIGDDHLHQMLLVVQIKLGPETDH